MTFDPTPYEIVPALLHWLIVFGCCLGVVLAVSLVTSLGISGSRGPANVLSQIGSGLTDTTRLSRRRIWALTLLTFREAVRRKALLVFIVFAILFMFAGWFLSASNDRPDLQVKVYVSFVLTAITWLILPVVLLLACWGLPEDIKARSLHTVVTKPARRNEVVIGRMLGFTLVGTVVLAIMGAVGYVWIVRQMPSTLGKIDEFVNGQQVRAARTADGKLTIVVTKDDEAVRSTYANVSELRKNDSATYAKYQQALQAAVDHRLACRVPVYGSLSFLTREGIPSDTGINVGDIWTYRSYIEGATKARAIWDFQGIQRDHLFQREGETYLRLESRFEAFRTHKGTMTEGLLVQFELVNVETGLRVPLRFFEVHEFGQNITEVHLDMEYSDPKTQEPKTASLFEDIIQNGKLRIEAACLDAGQYLGMSRPDLFIRTPDKPFASGYFKALLGIWLMMVLVVVLGVTAGCFVKGPVATLLTFALLVVGQGFREFMGKIVAGSWKGGGPVESVIRILRHLNPRVPLEDSISSNATLSVIQFVDGTLTNGLWLVQQIIPNFDYYKMSPYVANGFDVDWSSALLPSIAITMAYLLPCLLIGHFSLKLRELEAK